MVVTIMPSIRRVIELTHKIEANIFDAIAPKVKQKRLFSKIFSNNLTDEIFLLLAS
jgi:hypothetical protein